MKFFFAFLFCLFVLPAHASICSGTPTTFVNGTPANADQVNCTIVPHASNLAALKAMVPSYANQPVIRDGYAAAGDGGNALYIYSTTPCTLSGGAGDNGLQVQPGVVVGCWNAQFTAGAIDIRVWGAKGDGITDAAPFFATACTSIPGGTFNVPAGVFFWNTAETFTTSCLFVGQGFNERNQSPLTAEAGTWFKITNTGILPFTWHQNNQGGSGGFEMVAFEQSHPTPGPAWAPTVYQPLITLLGQASWILDNVYFYNIYAAINEPGTAGSNGRLQASHIKGQTFSYFMNATEILDVQHVDDIHLYPFWSNDNNVVTWTEAHGQGIILARSDGLQSDHMFMLGYESCLTLGYESVLPSMGASTNTYIGDLYCDASKYAVTITGNGTTLDIGKLSYASEGFGVSWIAGANMILDSSSGSYISIGNIVEQGVSQSVFDLTAAAGAETYNVGNAIFYKWNQDAGGEAAIIIANAASPTFIRFANPAIFVVPGTQVNLGTGAYVTNVWLPWTPTLYGDSTAGTPTYITQTGEYIIIGNTIVAKGFVSVSAISGGPSGNALIGGLPFANGSATETFGSINAVSGVTLTGGYTNTAIALPTAVTPLQVLKSGNGVSTVQGAIGLFTNCALGFEIAYRLF